MKVIEFNENYGMHTFHIPWTIKLAISNIHNPLLDLSYAHLIFAKDFFL